MTFEMMDEKVLDSVQEEHAEKTVDVESDSDQAEQEASTGEQEGDPSFMLTDDQRHGLDLNETTLAAITDVFKRLYEDGGGTFDLSELGTALVSLGAETTEDELQVMIWYADADASGTLDFFEFAKMVSEKLRVRDPEQEMRDAFAAFDKDGDGRISADEIRSVMESRGETVSAGEVESMLLEADDNNDGFLDYTEFVKVWMDVDSSNQNEKDETENSTKPTTDAETPDQ